MQHVTVSVKNIHKTIFLFQDVMEEALLAEVQQPGQVHHVHRHVGFVHGQSSNIPEN